MTKIEYSFNFKLNVMEHASHRRKTEHADQLIISERTDAISSVLKEIGFRETAIEKYIRKYSNPSKKKSRNEGAGSDIDEGGNETAGMVEKNDMEGTSNGSKDSEGNIRLKFLQGKNIEENVEENPDGARDRDGGTIAVAVKPKRKDTIWSIFVKHETARLKRINPNRKGRSLAEIGSNWKMIKKQNNGIQPADLESIIEIQKTLGMCQDPECIECQHDGETYLIDYNSGIVYSNNPEEAVKVGMWTEQSGIRID